MPVLLTLGLVLAPGAFAQGITLETARQIDALFAPWDRFDSPGAAVAVLRDGEIVYERGYGLADLETRSPITRTTVFHVASVSKQFTDFAAVLLEQDGLLDLDDDIHQHVPEVGELGAQVTLRHLAHHTSGIRDQWELLAISGTRLDDVIETRHILELAARQRELNFEPGSEYLYSNMGFTLIAEAVARAAGKPFKVVCHERIFRPLGMTHTHFHDDHRHLVPNRAYSYQPGEHGWEKAVLSFANAGATSLFTTAGDLSRWLANLETKAVGGEAGIEALLTKGRLRDGSEIDYALGLTHGRYRGLPTLSHGGADAGFRSIVLFFPEQRLGVVVLANVPAVDPGTRAGEVAAILLGDLMEALPSDAAAASEASEDGVASEAPTFDAPTLDRFVGTYRLEEIGAVIEILRRESSLVAVVPGTGEIELAAIAEREFEAERLGGRLRFEPPVNGHSPSLVASIPGQQLRAVRVVPLPDLDLSQYSGWYFSPELETLYHLSPSEVGLRASHVRNEQISLIAVAEDEFQGDAWFFGQVTFERDDERAVSGFRLNGGRVRNLRFVRIDALGLDLH